MKQIIKLIYEIYLSNSLIFRSILGSCALVALACCATSDPGAELLKANINKNPQPDAVVGMWHRENGGSLTTPISSTFLFKKNGEAYRYQEEILGKVDKYEYYYQGDGIWELFYISGGKKWPSGTVSLSDRCLILTDYFHDQSWIFKRSEN